MINWRPETEKPEARAALVINGHRITAPDIIAAKRLRQACELQRRRRNTDQIIKPCFVWVFWTNGLGNTRFFMGWWLYVQTAKRYWQLDTRRHRDKEIILKAMSLFPCDHTSAIENFEAWMPDFAEQYHRATIKRPNKNGLALAQAVMDPTAYRLVDIEAAT